MSDEVGDVCSLLEVIETEQVVEILEESQFLDLSPLETRGEVPAAGASVVLARGDEPAAAVETEGAQLAGQKRKRVYACKTPNIHNIQAFSFSLPQLLSSFSSPVSAATTCKRQGCLVCLSLQLLFLPHHARPPFPLLLLPNLSLHLPHLTRRWKLQPLFNCRAPPLQPPLLPSSSLVKL